jgi:hypothetical protein
MSPHGRAVGLHSGAGVEKRRHLPLQVGTQPHAVTIHVPRPQHDLLAAHPP